MGERERCAQTLGKAQVGQNNAKLLEYVTPLSTTLRRISSTEDAYLSSEEKAIVITFTVYFPMGFI